MGSSSRITYQPPRAIEVPDVGTPNFNPLQAPRQMYMPHFGAAPVYQDVVSPNHYSQNTAQTQQPITNHNYTPSFLNPNLSYLANANIGMPQLPPEPEPWQPRMKRFAQSSRRIMGVR